MGGSSYSHDDYKSRVTTRAAAKAPVFVHDAAVKAGTAKAAVEPRMDPKGAIRECRDSDAHPVTIPICVFFDTTGSMAEVPGILEAHLPKLMGAFLDDKASGKRYLGDAYPSILIGAFDDYDAQSRFAHSGTLQVGQFESGIEIDNDLEKIWLTGNGGGTDHESSQLAIYFADKRTACDHIEKRGKKGYIFVISDEHPYPEVRASEVAEVIGGALQGNMTTDAVVAAAKANWNIFFIMPNLTQHWHSQPIFKGWQTLLGQQNALRLDDPSKICECIASCVAICEGRADLDDLIADGVATGFSEALVPLSRGAVVRVSADDLPATTGTASAIERL